MTQTTDPTLCHSCHGSGGAIYFGWGIPCNCCKGDGKEPKTCKHKPLEVPDAH